VDYHDSIQTVGFAVILFSRVNIVGLTDNRLTCHV